MDRKQINLRPDPAALDRFRKLRSGYGLSGEELFEELLSLIPGDTLDRVLGMAEAQGVAAGELVRRLVEEEWNRHGYRWEGAAP